MVCVMQVQGSFYFAQIAAAHIFSGGMKHSRNVLLSNKTVL